MALSMMKRTAGQCAASTASTQQHAAAPRATAATPLPPRRRLAAAAPLRAAATDESASSSSTKTVVVKNSPGEMPFPWSEKDPYKLPIAIDRVQRLLVTLGWERPWVEQIVDRVMKGSLKTTEERASAVVEYLTSIGLRQDEVCNMASISVVLLGLNPETRLKAVVEYLKARGVPADGVAAVVLAHPRIFEYKVSDVSGATTLTKGAARIQVDVLPAPGGSPGDVAVGVNYFRENASFLGPPVTPMPPMPAA